jgi:hypothetical protein
MLQSRQVKFAVGCVVILLLLRWLMTGDLLAVAQAVQPQPESNVSSVSIVSVVLPMVIDAIVLIGAAVIAGSLKLWSFLLSLIDQVNQKGQPAPEPATALKTGSDIAVELARAVAVDDRDAVKQLQREIRRPYVISEISRSAASGDLALADRLLAELRRIDEQPEPTNTQAKAVRSGSK